jgi:hypothetical protein
MTAIRRLAAILAADIAGHSPRPMQCDKAWRRDNIRSDQIGSSFLVKSRDLVPYRHGSSVLTIYLISSLRRIGDGREPS